MYFSYSLLKAFKYRISPNKEQVVLINKHIDAVRFMFNLALETKQTAWGGYKVNLSCFDLINQIPDLKKECPWLKEINSQSLQSPIRNLDNAFTRFFKGLGNFPNFKKKSNVGSFNVPQNVSIVDGNLVIPKFKKGITIILHRPINGLIKQATISRTPTGKYFVSILCETNDGCQEKQIVRDNTTIGIDLGIKSYLVTSDGLKINNPKFLRNAQAKLKFIQRKYSKNKSKKHKKLLAQLHEKITNQRKDFLHKTSIKLIRENQSLAIETLRVSNMVKNHKLAMSIIDSGWSLFVNMLEYKAEWYGVNVLKIGSFEPSSKCCSSCGYINKELSLKDRDWICPNCNVLIDRDVNAAINIKNFAIRNYLSVERRQKNRKELPTLVGVMTSEALSALPINGSSL